MEALMPPVKNMAMSNLKGFEAAETPQKGVPPLVVPQKTTGVNPYIRCPLPPFNAGPDTLRQFDENGKIPARRVIPLPVSTNSSGSTTVIQNTSVTSSSGGGSGTIVVAIKTVTVNAGPLLPGQSALLKATVAKAAVLMILGSSDLCEIRIYGDKITQAGDLPRATDTAVPFEITPGVVTDVVLDTHPLQFNWQNRLFVNQDSPQTTNLYVTVVNPTGATVTPSITITYLPLE